MEINELAFYSEPLTAGTHRSVGPTCQQYENRGATLLDAEQPEFSASELFCRRHRHYEHPHDIAHTLSYLVGPIVGANDDGGEHDGIAAWHGSAPAISGQGKARRERLWYHDALAKLLGLF